MAEKNSGALVFSLVSLVLLPVGIGQDTPWTYRILHKTDSWGWSSGAFTLCENVGVLGSARYFVEANYDIEQLVDKHTGQPAPMSQPVYIVTSLTLHGESASFDGETALSASMDSPIFRTGRWTVPVPLSRPRTASFEAKPGPYATRNLYWSKGDDNCFADRFIFRDTGKCRGFQITAVRPDLRITVDAVKEDCNMNRSVNVHTLAP